MEKKSSYLEFRCVPCGFSLDIKCALLPTLKMDGYKRIRAAYHDHTLTIKDGAYKLCNACEKRCFGPIYDCNSCNFSLHKHCFEFPQEIQSRFHRHPLRLTDFSDSDYKEPKRLCSLCFGECSNIAFSCSRCSFRLHIECLSLTPTIKYQGHGHSLHFLEKVNAKLKCNACSFYLLEDSLGFRCVTCDFNLHLLCGPLPLIIKHTRHVDPLMLRNFHIEGDEDDANEIYCDACEGRRDHREPVYYCAEGCPFVSEVRCVISEVIATLKGERDNVKLRSVFGWSQDNKENGLVTDNLDLDYDVQEEKDSELCPSKLAPVYLNSGDMRELANVSAVKRKICGSETKPHQDDQKQKDKFTPSSKQDFFQLQNRLDWEMCMRLFNFCNKTGGIPFSEELARISLDDKRTLDDVFGRPNHFIDAFNFPRILLPVYEVLCPKYEAITASSYLSPDVKLVFFAIPCAVIFGMERTTVTDLTEEKLADWMALLRLVECFGFNVNFIWDHLRRVTRAYFGLSAKKLAEDTINNQQQEITQIVNEINELTIRLETKKEEHHNYKLFVQSATTNSYMKECLDETLGMKLKPVVDGLFN